MHLPEERKPEHRQMGSPAVSSRSGGDVYGCAPKHHEWRGYFLGKGWGRTGNGVLEFIKPLELRSHL